MQSACGIVCYDETTLLALNSDTLMIYMLSYCARMRVVISRWSHARMDPPTNFYAHAPTQKIALAKAKTEATWPHR